MAQRREEHRRVRDPAGDHHVCAGFELNMDPGDYQVRVFGFSNDAVGEYVMRARFWPIVGEGGPCEGAVFCDDCLALPRPWEQGRAALSYRDTGRRVVLARRAVAHDDLDGVGQDREGLANLTVVFAEQPLI